MEQNTAGLPTHATNRHCLNTGMTLLDQLPAILTDTEPLQACIRQLLYPACAARVYQLYTPDITGQQLEPGLQWCATAATGQDFPAVPLDDLNHPLSHSYRTHTRQAAFPLHGRVINSDAWHALQQQHPQNLYLQIELLQIEPHQPPHGILLLFNTPPEVTPGPTWAGKLRLFTALLQQQQHYARQHQARHQQQQQLRQKTQHQHQQQQQSQIAARYIGTDAASRAVQHGIQRAAQHEQNILIQGETGSGKDLVATLIHQHSARAEQPFIAVNCAAIPEHLIEAELFGTSKGAYTGSTHQREGLIAAADGGTLFLDEIGDMPLHLQAILLRVLQQKTYRRLGETRERQANFRLLSATHAPLRERIREQRFRQDLYYRIAQQHLEVPALRVHRQDIPALTRHLIHQYNQTHGQHHPPLTANVLTRLQQHHWPGNVRELQNVVHRYLTDQQLHLMPEITERDDTQHITDLRAARQQFEKHLIQQRLNRYHGNRARAAASLGLPKRTLAHKCQQYAIRTPS